jgi:two-component system LytT family response regulator
MKNKITPTLKCLIVDDEPDAHAVLEQHINRIGWLQVTASLYDGVEALTNIPIIKPDIVFLDVQMANLTGLQLLKLLPAYDSQIILTTGHSEFAKDGYDFGVTDFLLKPILFERFLQATNKARLTHYNLGHSPLKDTVTKSYDTFADTPEWKDLPSPTFTSRYILLRVDKKIHHVPYDDILFVQSLANYVNVQTRYDCLTTRGALSEFTNKLPSGQFLQTHKSYMINRKYVRHIDGNLIYLDDNFKVPISRADRQGTLKWLAK